MDGSVIPGILISCGTAVVVGVLVLAAWQFAYVWLDDDVLEVRQGRTVVRVPLSELTEVELVRDRTMYIRLRFEHRGPVKFIPSDASYFAGGGERTRKQLYDLVHRGHRS